MSPVCENKVLDGLLVERDASKGELVGKGKSNNYIASSHAPCDTLFPGESKQLIPSLIHFRLRAGVSTRGLQMDNASKGGGDQGGITLR